MKFFRSSIKDLYFFRSAIISNFKRLTFPFKLSFAITYRCNLHCAMCNIWGKKIVDQELTLQEIASFFKEADQFSWVGITGGEPFIRKDLPEIINIIVQYCRVLNTIHFATNAQLNDKIAGIVEHIHNKKYKPRVIFTISIDGPPGLHDKIRGEAGAWDKAIQTFIYLKQLKSVRAQIGYTVSPRNIGRFQDAFTTLKNVYPSLRFDDISVNIFQKSSFYYENQNMEDLHPQEIKEEIKTIQRLDRDKISINNFLRRNYLNLYIKYLNSKKCPLKCQALSSTCFLDPYGNLFPCAVYNRKLINVKEIHKRLKSFWISEDARNLSYECSHNRCPGCWSPCDAYSAITGSLLKVGW